MVLILVIFVISIIESSLANNPLDINSTFIIPCNSFGTLDNGEIVETLDGDLHLTCKQGYDLVGSRKISCVDGKWLVADQPKCEPRCREPSNIHNGVYEIDVPQGADKMYKKGALATYDCGERFVLSPPESKYRVCEMGIWTGATATCTPRVSRCRIMGDIKNGRIIHAGDRESFPIGHAVEYVCNNGFILKGESKQRCLEDGSWTPLLPPICVPIDVSPTHCPPAPTFPNTYVKVISGYQSFDSAIDGSVIEVLCVSKYRNAMSPCEPAKLRCVAGQWMGIPPNCELVTECKRPPTVPLGTPFQLASASFDIDKDTRYPINTTISYLCVAGYELDGFSMLTCSVGGCWEPNDPPVCKIKQRYYYMETSSGEPILFSLATGAGVLILLVVACLIIVCRKRKPLSRSVPIPPPVPRADLADHATLLHPPDRLALIAFADGMQVGQSGLPTYEEATRDRSLGITSSRLQRPPWPSLVSRRSRNSPNPENILFTRQGSFASHSASIRSGDPMGSTDTMAVSENSTTVTLDTASSHSGSQPASCRAHCGSLASFDTSSVLNTEGVPLLEESELEEIQCGDTVSLAMDNRSMCDNTSYKLSTASDVA